MYLDEIQEQLYIERRISVSYATLQRVLHRLRYTYKRVSARALERNDLLRSAFMNRIADEISNPDMLMFVDEAARNKKTSARTNGWSLMGKRCVQRQCFSRGERFSILPILTLYGIITYDIVPGSVTSERFLQFLRELVVCAYISTFGHVSNAVRMPCRSPFPIPTQVPEASLFLITAISITLKKCANLSKMMLVCIYQSRVSSMLMFLPDCKLIFLPPYSPDLNPIEQAFSAIKSYLRRFCNDYTFLVIDRACQNITSEKAWGFFRASGYVV
jgi:hypothetical protein